MNAQPENKKTKYSSISERLSKGIERLTSEAEQGNYQAQMRLETMIKLTDPTLDFCHSDFQRILNKGHSLQVQRGMQLYRLMQRISRLVEPSAEKIGPACPVKLIPFDTITWEAFLDLRVNFTGAHFKNASKSKERGRFSGEDYLDDEEIELWRRLKPYFGSKKKPTLQSLAINILNEDDNCKGFSERNLYNYLEAVRYHVRKRQKASGFDTSLFAFHEVESFGSSKKTIRESVLEMRQLFIRYAEMNASYLASLRVDALSAFAQSNYIKDFMASIPLSCQYNTKEALARLATQLTAPASAIGKQIGVFEQFARQLGEGLTLQFSVRKFLSQDLQR